VALFCGLVALSPATPAPVVLSFLECQNDGVVEILRIGVLLALFVVALVISKERKIEEHRQPSRVVRSGGYRVFCR